MPFRTQWEQRGDAGRRSLMPPLSLVPARKAQRPAAARPWRWPLTTAPARALRPSCRSWSPSYPMPWRSARVPGPVRFWCCGAASGTARVTFAPFTRLRVW